MLIVLCDFIGQFCNPIRYEFFFYNSFFCVDQQHSKIVKFILTIKHNVSKINNIIGIFNRERGS